MDQQSTMKAIFKYSGGKTREAPFLASLLPTAINKIVEPFGGSGALSFYSEKPAIIGDTRADAVNCLQVIQDPKTYPILQAWVDDLKIVRGKFKLEPIFYHWRDTMWPSTDPLERAFRWIVIRQMAFSGIDRVNAKTGKENGPFGWYDKFSCNLSVAHHTLLQSWTLRHQGFEETLAETSDDFFVFLDPPYLTRNSSYGGQTPDETLHTKLLTMLNDAHYKWLLVHCEHPLYAEFARNFFTVERAFAYSQNFKGRDNSNSKTKHLYIKNFND
jgi:DNA adenine methylase